MGLDIYAGTLTRYYAHNWKTVVQQWAEKNGFGFQFVTPEGQQVTDGQQMTPAEIQTAMENWRDQVLAAITPPDREPYVPWTEDNETPYYTDKPDWDALGAMLLVAACHTYDEPVPPTVEKNWNFMAHPVIDRFAKDQERIWSLFRGAIWWLPLPDYLLFQGPLPTGCSGVISTTAALGKELEKVNDLAWQADEDTICGWCRTEGYPVEGEVGKGGVFTKLDVPEQTQYDTQSLAKFAFSMFYQAVKFAEEKRVPILLDF